MSDYFLTGRAALKDAMLLLEQYGPEAPAIAAERANASRDKENLLGFCHWRQIERFTASLSDDFPVERLH